MEQGTFIQTVEIPHPNVVGQVISLDVYDVPGGYIGLSEEYKDIANWIFNPFGTLEPVKLENPTEEEEVDPPLIEDQTVNLLLIVNAMDKAVQEMNPTIRDTFISGVSKLAGLTEDQVSLLLGTAQEFVDDFNKAEEEEIVEEPKPSKPFKGLRLTDG